MEFMVRGGKSAATWQPSYQKVFQESGSGRKFLDPITHFLSIKQFVGNGKEILSVKIQSGHILHF